MFETRSNLSLKYSSAKALFMWHFLNKSLPLVLVSEFPKSGGTWFCQMMSSALDIPFPRNVHPTFQECIMHSHLSYHKNFDKVLYIVRDGRDIMVSAFYYILKISPGANNTRAERFRKDLGITSLENISELLPSFIEYFMENYTVLGKNTNWQDHIKQYSNNENILQIKYEDLLIDSAGQLQKALDFLERKSTKDLNQIAVEYTFENQAKRKAGQEIQSSFLRKGIAGDWKNKFTKESAEVFDFYAGDVLISLGYEKDVDWAKKL